MNKLIVLGILGLLLVSCMFLYNLNEDEIEGEYYGPVPIGYNVEHFRKTGETIREVIE